MTVRKFLDLSTAHLSPEARAWLSEAATMNHAAAYHGTGNGAAMGTLGATLTGWFMHAPALPEDGGMDYGMPEAMLPIIRFARSLNCDYVLFDADADEIEHLPTYDGDGDLINKDEPFERAATAAGWRHGGDNGGFWFDGNEFESWKAAASADDAATYGSAREVCEREGIEVEGATNEV